VALTTKRVGAGQALRTFGATAFSSSSQRWLLTWSKLCRINFLTM
jgi:hypothetical protein